MNEYMSVNEWMLIERINVNECQWMNVWMLMNECLLNKWKNAWMLIC